MMGYVSKEMSARAREISVLDYLLRYESSNIRRVGSSYRLKDHDSLAVSEKGFYWHSKGFGGVTALDFLMKVRDYDFVSAVCHILGERPLEKGATSNYKPQFTTAPGTLSKSQQTYQPLPEKAPTPNRQPLLLPRRNKDNFQVIAYLQNRGIDRSLILDCINRGVLYESAVHHNVIFLGKDEQDKTRFAALRATTGDFKRDADGSDKRYGFVIPPQNLASDEIAIFESPIDCLSHQSLCKQGYLPDFQGWRLSLGGTSLNAVTHFLEQHPEISHCLICTDNDMAGNKAAEKIAQEISIYTERSPPIQAKDWNDMLTGILQAQRLKNRTAQTVVEDTPCL